MARDISGCNYYRGTRMTQRGPQTLARHYGFGSVEALADGLPPDATILDAGAGASRFGHTIAAMRPDIRWTNLDIGYADEPALASLRETAPDNVTFLQGSILDATALLPYASQDRVFSYFALNYLGNFRAAAAKQLMGVAKPTGQVALGKLWIVRDHVATPSTIRLSPGYFHGFLTSHIAKALHEGAPPLDGAEYNPVRGDDSIK